MDQSGRARPASPSPSSPRRCSCSSSGAPSTRSCPLAWLRRRNVTGPLASQFFANFAYMGGFILTPVLLEEGLGYSTAFVGLLIIARPLAFSITAPAGRLRHRAGPGAGGRHGRRRRDLRVDDAARHDRRRHRRRRSSPSRWRMSGVGLGISAPAMTATVANAVADEDLGVAAALQQLMTQVGAVVGHPGDADGAGVDRGDVRRGRQLRQRLPRRCGGGASSPWLWPSWCGPRCPPPRRRSARPRRWRRRYAVMSLISSATFLAVSSGAVPCICMSFIMSPCTLILPDMNACIPACGSWSTKILRAVS